MRSRWIIGGVLFASALAAHLANGPRSSVASYSYTYTYDDDPASRAGSITTGSTVLTQTVNATAGLVASRISGFNRPGGSPLTRTAGLTTGPDVGLASGGDAVGAGLWFNIGYSRILENTSSVKSSGHIITGVVGGDYAITPQLLVGAALAFDKTLLDTSFNAGDVQETAYGIVPYLSYTFDDMFSADLLAGYQRTHGDQQRTVAVTGVVTEADYTGSRYFVNAAGNAFHSFGNASVLGSLSLLWAQGHTNSFSEDIGTFVGHQVNDLGQLNVSVTPSYAFVDNSAGLVFEPYMKLGYRYDFVREDINVAAGQQEHANDPDEINLGGGFNLYSATGVTANLDFSTALTRENFESYSGAFTLRFDF